MIKIGDKVQFVDKYGVTITGTYTRDHEFDGVKSAVVKAQPFGPGVGDIDCVVPYPAMERVKP